MERIVAGRRTRRVAQFVMLGALVWVLTGGLGAPAQAQSTFNQDFRLWAPVYLNVNLPARFLGYMEVNPRLKEDVSTIDQLLLRPALGYQLTEKLSLWQGYAWVGNFNQPHQPSQSPFFEENRIYQQANYKDRFSSFKFLSRTRLEERWIEHADGTAVRFRQMLRLDYPLPIAPDWALVSYDEIFINLNTVGAITGKGPAAGFDQNRFFVGINRTFNQYLNVDLGYQNQLLNSRQLSGLANQMNNIIMLQFFINM